MHWVPHRARGATVLAAGVSPPSPMCVEPVERIKRFFYIAHTYPAVYVYRVYVPVELHPR